MARDFSLVDFENLLIIKNQLITLDSEKLIELYNGVSEYTTFLNTVISLLSEESAFLYLDNSFIDKIYDVMQIHRFEISDDDTIDSINKITNCLNDIKYCSDDYRKLIVSNYKEYQKSIRNVGFASNQDFLYSLSFDAVVYLGLKGFVEIPFDDNLLVLSSINYMINSFSDVFRNVEMYDATLDKLNYISKESNIFSLSQIALSYKVKRKLKNIRLKEE